MKARLKRPASVPDDTLSAVALEPAYLGGTGLPDAADAIAYDPVQRLLAVRIATQPTELNWAAVLQPCHESISTIES